MLTGAAILTVCESGGRDDQPNSRIFKRISFSKLLRIADPNNNNTQYCWAYEQLHVRFIRILLLNIWRTIKSRLKQLPRCLKPP